jgi:riboflavin transporter FmnP
MDSKKISILIVFAALTVFLNISPIKIPAPYAPFLIYQLWEIPIVTVSLLYGFQMGISVSIINTLILLLIYPGALPTGPI